ncbi:hypothetical protein FS749_004561 [Ceratobasidium sp. UAMH 11750]|nr:hypothetical protein FS749_004561 [Ceratobasidium sp. UAMH 11750]
MSAETDQHRTHALESLVLPRPQPPPPPARSHITRHNASRRYALTIDVDSPNERALRAMLASAADPSALRRRASSSASSAGARIITPNSDGHRTMQPSTSSLASSNPTPPNFFLSRPTVIHARRPPCLKCAICYELMPSPPGGCKTPTKRCTHNPVVCPECLERYVVSRISESGFTDFVCPTSMCTEGLEYEDVRAAIQDQAVLERYEYLLLRRYLQNMPNFVWCKNPECSSGQVHDGSLCPTVTCNACGAESCFTHDMPWHTGLTCSQYDSKTRKTRSEGIRANQKYLSKHAKACPNPKCGRMIEKINGCDHMTCARPVGCGHEFCWSCLADYGPINERGNRFHKRKCRHYDSRLKLLVQGIIMRILRVL